MLMDAIYLCCFFDLLDLCFELCCFLLRRLCFPPCGVEGGPDGSATAGATGTGLDNTGVEDDDSGVKEGNDGKATLPPTVANVSAPMVTNIIPYITTGYPLN